MTMIDHGAFMSGVALAAATSVFVASHRRPVWEDALAYLEAATAMGLVMAESA